MKHVSIANSTVNLHFGGCCKRECFAVDFTKYLPSEPGTYTLRSQVVVLPGDELVFTGPSGLFTTSETGSVVFDIDITGPDQIIHVTGFGAIRSLEVNPFVIDTP